MRRKSAPQRMYQPKRQRRDAPTSAVALRLLAPRREGAGEAELFKWLVACVREELVLGSEGSFVGTLLNASAGSVPIANALRGSSKSGAFKKLRSLTTWPQAAPESSLIAAAEWLQLAALLRGDAEAASARYTDLPTCAADATLCWPDGCDETRRRSPVDAVLLSTELSSCPDGAARAAMLDIVCAHRPRSVIVFDFFASDGGTLAARYASARADTRVAVLSCRSCRQSKSKCRCSAGLAARVLAARRTPSSALDGAALVRAMACRGYHDCSVEVAPASRGFLLLCFKVEGGWEEC